MSPKAKSSTKPKANPKLKAKPELQPQPVPQSPPQLPDFLQQSITICEDRQAENVVVYNLQDLSIVTDYCLICSGRSTTHIRALSNYLAKAFKEHGQRPRSIEGASDSEWILLDYRNFIIHIFTPNTREFYDLESMYSPDQRIYSGLPMNR